VLWVDKTCGLEMAMDVPKDISAFGFRALFMNLQGITPQKTWSCRDGIEFYCLG